MLSIKKKTKQTKQTKQPIYTPIHVSTGNLLYYFDKHPIISTSNIENTTILQ